MMHVGDTMSTLRDVQYIRGYHEYIGGYHEYTGVFNRNWKDLSSCSPKCIMISLWCAEHPSMYSWYPPHASWYPPMYWTSPQCTNGISPMYWTSPDAHMVSPTFIMISPDVLNMPRCTHDIPSCTEHPLMYWISPNLLNTHYTRWTFYGWIVWHIWNTTVIFLLLPW